MNQRIKHFLESHQFPTDPWEWLAGMMVIGMVYIGWVLAYVFEPM